LGDATHGVSELAVIIMLGNGFIITSMVWASFVVALIDQRPVRAALVLGLGAVLTACGIIHSVEPAGGIYLPWQLDAAAQSLMAQFAGAYLALALTLLMLSTVRRSASPAGDPGQRD